MVLLFFSVWCFGCPSCRSGRSYIVGWLNIVEVHCRVIWIEIYVVHLYTLCGLPLAQIHPDINGNPLSSHNRRITVDGDFRGICVVLPWIWTAGGLRSSEHGHDEITLWKCVEKHFFCPDLLMRPATTRQPVGIWQRQSERVFSLNSRWHSSAACDWRNIDIAWQKYAANNDTERKTTTWAAAWGPSCGRSRVTAVGNRRRFARIISGSFLGIFEEKHRVWIWRKRVSAVVLKGKQARGA